MLSTLNRSASNFGQLAGAVEAGGIGHERRQDFGIAVVLGMDVQHEIDERAFELRAQTPVDGETRAGDFGGALEIENAEVGAQVPMGVAA